MLRFQHSELTRSAVQPPPNKSVLDVPEWAAPPGPGLGGMGGGLPGGGQRLQKQPTSQKKDGLVQKGLSAFKYLVKMGGGRAPELGPPPAEEGERRPLPAPCVMVPLRPPPAPAPPPAPQAPPS